MLAPEAGAHLAVVLREALAVPRAGASVDADVGLLAIDDLVEMVAAFGFDYRTQAEAAVAASYTTMMSAAVGGSTVSEWPAETNGEGRCRPGRKLQRNSLCRGCRRGACELVQHHPVQHLQYNE